MNNPSASAKADYHRRRREHQRLNVPLFIASLEGVKTPEQILLECEQAKRLDQLIDQLKPPRMGLVVRYYYGIRCEPGTLEQVSQKFGVTRERIRQILNKALRILRHWMLKADDRKRYLENLDREIAERRANERRLEALRDTEYEKNAHQEWEQTEEQRELRAKQLTETWAEWEAKQRAWEKRRAKQEFDYAYHEAHRVNALWEFELERRADEGRLQAKRAERRLREEQRFERERFELERVKKLKLEARMKRAAERRAQNRWAERDWLLVGSK